MISPAAPVSTRRPFFSNLHPAYSRTNLDVLRKEVTLQNLGKTHSDPAKHRTCHTQQRLSDQLP